MGEFANQQAWHEYEHRQSKVQEEHFEPTEPLTEAERAAQFDDFYWDRLDLEARHFGGAR